jgi:outer membrane protein OmpA-like peptidoglycan-associated protein/protocatechuate 3,4-dioxygenase beta subunit
MRTFLVGLVVLFSAVSGFSQGNVADDLFYNFEYKEAIKYYNQASDLTLNQKENLAYCHYMIHDYENAKKLYAEIISTDDVEPLFYQFYAVSLKNTGEYDKAKEYFTMALESDSTLVVSKVGLQSLDKLPELMSQKERLEVVGVGALNNGASSYSPKWYKDGILFCSEEVHDSLKRRPHIDINNEFSAENELVYGMSERPWSEVFYSKLNGEEAEGIEVFASNEKFHIGDFFLDSDGTLYFTKVDFTNKWDPNVRNHPRLFKGTITEAGLEDVQKVKIKKLSNEVGSGHPFIVEENGKKTLYFSSDMPGGYGGSDLYKTTQDDKGNWVAPTNLGAKINTAGDELFPSVQEGQFYFSSNGHPGYGGMDIYRVDATNLNGEIELLERPINSSGDDLSVLMNPDQEDNGLVTSSRFGGQGDDDIYMYRLRLDGFFVQGTVRDLNGDPVPNAIVKIYDEEGNEVAQAKTDENGNYLLEVGEEGDYELVATIPGYGDKEPVAITEDWDSNNRIDMTLEPMLTAQGVVMNEDGSPAGNVDVELRDDNGDIVYKGKTDENGYYQFPLEENETYTAFATDGTLAGSETFTTDAGYDPLEDTNIQLGPVYTVNGVVLDEEGNPVAGALVKIYDENGNEIAQVRTDENGEYTIPIYEDGSYQVVATIPGYGDIEQVVIDENWDNDGQIVMNLEPMLTAQGIVKNEDGTPAGKVDIELTDEDGNVIYKGRTDENGYYQFPLEEDQTYTALAEDGMRSGQETFTTDKDYDPLEDTDIVLKSGTYVEGIVLDEDGNVVEGAVVKLFDDEGNLIATTTTDENGEYHFDLGLNENYQIIAETDGFQAVENIFTGENFDPNDKLELHLEPVGTDSFALVEDNETKEGIAGVKVTVVDNESKKKFVTTTDSQGRFNIKISPNRSYSIHLEKDGYYPKTVKIKAGEIPEKVDLNQMGDFGMDYAGYDVKKIYFELDQSSLTKESKEQLDKIVKLLKANKDAVITIRSYADCRGPVKYNVSLSWKRSKAVREYLVKNGISSSRILTESLGATNFVNNCSTPEACSESEHALNRRSEFEIDFNK